MDWELRGDLSDSDTEKTTTVHFKSTLTGVGDSKNSSDSEDLSPKQTSSLTKAMEELSINEEVPRINLCPQLADEIRNDNVPKRVSSTIRTRAQDTMTPCFLKPEDVLWHQGIQFSGSEIAPLFKKDCRMWLWKGQARFHKKIIMSDALRRGVNVRANEI